MNTPENIQTLANISENYGRVLEGLLLFAIRNNENNELDEFNDLIGFYYKDTIVLHPGTTDPGVFWTSHHFAPPNGAAHYQSGMHYNLYQLGWHYNEKALVQGDNPAWIWRDDDDNFVHNQQDRVQYGCFGMNMHSSNNAKKIGKWSAGCQVLQYSKHLAHIVSTVFLYERLLNRKTMKHDYLIIDKEEWIEAGGTFEIINGG